MCVWPGIEERTVSLKYYEGYAISITNKQVISLVKIENPKIKIVVKDRPAGFSKAGDKKVLVLTGTTLIPKVVDKFSEDLPVYHKKDNPSGVIGRDYDELDKAQKKLVDTTVPDKWESGDPYEKFQGHLYLHFEERDNPKMRYLWDVKFYMHEDGRPKKDLYRFLTKFGRTIENGMDITEFFKTGGLYTATLVNRPGNDYPHIDPSTLEPYFDEDDATPEEE